MTMWLRILKSEIFRQLRNPLCIVCLLLPFLTVAVSLAMYGNRIEVYEMFFGSRQAGTAAVFMQNNALAWLVVMTMLVAQNAGSRPCCLGALPACRAEVWGAESVSVWLISLMHWSVFFILFGISSGVLLGTFLFIPLQAAATVLTCGGTVVMALAVAKFVRNPVLFVILFFCMFVFGSAVKAVQDYSIFSYLITPGLISDSGAADTVRFLSYVLPAYYVVFWFAGLAGSGRRKGAL